MKWILMIAVGWVGLVMAEPDQIQQVRDLEQQAEFSKAITLATELLTGNQDATRAEELQSLLGRLREERRTAVRLAFAIDSLGTQKEVAVRELRSDEAVATLLLRKVVRERDGAVLQFTTELEDVRPNMGENTGGQPTSNYSWSGGFLWVKGQNQSTLISAIVSEAKRGDQTFTVEKADGVKAGQRVVVEQTDDAAKSLLAHLYAGDPGDTGKILKPVTVRFVSRVAAVEGNRVTLERPLRWDVRGAWQPVLKTFAPTVAEVGIEELAISFPVKPYAGHFTERGMNGIAMDGVADCWVRNVRISNCDSGIFLGGSFSTIDGLVVDGQRPATGGDTGHHGVTLGQDCLLQNFDFQTKFIHDVTVKTGNVVKNGRGVNMSFDHHKRAPYENLFGNIDVGEGGQIWRSGGGAQLGKHCAARGTFWNIRARKEIAWPPAGFGPDLLNIVGVTASQPSLKDPAGKWFEAIPPDELQPADLHAAQLARRLKRQP
jgi:hypothetical protein